MKRTVSARQLDSFVTIEKPSAGFDAINQPLTTWQTHARVWASILAQSGAEAIRADKQTSSSKVSIRIRARTDLDATMRVVHGSTLYAIQAVQPAPSRQQFVDLVCEVMR